MDYQIHFPHLHIYLDHVAESFSLFGITVHLYGVVLAAAMLCGTAFVLWWAKQNGQEAEVYLDLAIVEIIFSVIGARIYYVIFQWDLYKDHPIDVLNIRQGGLAIYGGIIAAVITAAVFAKIRKVPLGRLADTSVYGLLIGQIIGRWGNFFNREAFGGYTDGLFAMQLPLSAVRRADVTQEQMQHLFVIDGVTYIQAHPTFLYESLWNLLLLLVMLVYFKHRRFEGQMVLVYFFGYGLGRFWIESLRTDSLLIPTLSIPISQALSGVLVVGSAVWMFIGCRRMRQKASPKTSEMRAGQSRREGS